MPHQRACIDIGQDWNPELLEIFLGHLLRAPVRTDSGKLAYNQALDIGSNSFVVFRIGAVIADLGVSQNYDLARVGRISKNFLVACDGSIKNDFAVAFAFCAVAFAAEDAPIFQRKDRLHSSSRKWILPIIARKPERTKHGLIESTAASKKTLTCT